jgi:hypothetical protein
MNRVAIAKAWSIVALMALPVCKTPGIDNSELASTVAAPVKGPGPEPLLKFEYEVDKTLLMELGARVGCAKASEIVSFPSSGILRHGIRKVAFSKNVYQSLQDEFFDARKTQSQCGSPSKKEKNSGVKELRKRVVGEASDTIFTIVIHGGFGDHMVFERTLDSVMDNWFDLMDEETDQTLDVYQFSCSNSMAPSKRCAKEMLLSMKERQEKSGGKKRKYLLWGYSSGSLTMLEALKMSPDLRNETVGLVTMGGPIGGSVAMGLVGPLVQKTATELAKSISMPESIAKSIPNSVLFLVQNQINTETFNGKLIELLNSSELAQIQAGAKELTTSERKKMLASDVAGVDFGRADGSSIPVYHFAALLDLARLNPTLTLTMKDGSAGLDQERFRYTHLATLGVARTLRDYPMSDGIVALPDAVLPKQNPPKGLSPQLLGLFKFDHFSNRLTPPENKKPLLPHGEIADAILGAISKKMSGGDQ